MSNLRLAILEADDGCYIVIKRSAQVSPERRFVVDTIKELKELVERLAAESIEERK